MQRRLLVAFLLWAPMQRVIVTADCDINPNVTCVENFVEKKPCVNLSGCEYIIEDTTKVVWYQCDGVHMSCEQRRVINTDNKNGTFYLSTETGLLCFRKLDKALTGVYCYKEMENSSCNPIQVVIVEKPTINATVNNVTVVTGGKAEQNVAILQCDRPMAGCPPAPVHWRYEGQELRNSSHFKIITNSNYTKLIINNVSVNDGGMYECEVEDTNSNMCYTDNISLTVSSAKTQTINASLCSDRQLTCDNAPSPAADYQWTHNEVNITTNEIAPNGSLNLFAIRSSDFGMYHCLFTPSPYGGTMVTQLLLVQQTAVPLISDYVFLLIYHHNQLLDINEILQMHINKLCGDCCDVTIVMGSLWQCPCSNTRVYMFKLNGTLAITAHTMLKNYFTANQTLGHDNLTTCVGNCCELCDNRASHDASDSDTDLAVTITMATLIVVLLILEATILISYHWYSRRLLVRACEKHRNDHVATISHGNSNGPMNSGEERHYDRLNHNHRNMNTMRTNLSYESIP